MSSSADTPSSPRSLPRSISSHQKDRHLTKPPWLLSGPHRGVPKRKPTLRYQSKFKRLPVSPSNGRTFSRTWKWSLRSREWWTLAPKEKEILAAGIFHKYILLIWYPKLPKASPTYGWLKYSGILPFLHNPPIVGPDCQKLSIPFRYSRDSGLGVEMFVFSPWKSPITSSGFLNPQPIRGGFQVCFQKKLGNPAMIAP